MTKKEKIAGAKVRFKVAEGTVVKYNPMWQFLKEGGYDGLVEWSVIALGFGHRSPPL